MTMYTNFIQDFPRRCIELLDKHFEQAKASDREVTLMLAIATAAFVIPFERLRPPPETHPADDVSKYKAAKQKFNKAVNSHFLLSPQWGQGKSWEIIEAVDGVDIREKQIDDWARREWRQPLPKNKPANAIFSHLRNALTHGSVFTFPVDTGLSSPPQIETIVLLSRSYQEQEVEKCGKKATEKVLVDKYNILIVSPEDFRVSLTKWVTFLDSLDLITTVTQHSFLPLPDDNDEQNQ